MKLFGNPRPVKWRIGDAAKNRADHEAHMYRLAFIANEHVAPYGLQRVRLVETSSEMSNRLSTFATGNPAVGKPFRTALWAWLRAWFESRSFERFESKTPFAMWNGALECRGNFAEFGGDSWTNERVLEFVECEWAAEALRLPFASETERELNLLRAENKALRGGKGHAPIGWKKYMGDDTRWDREFLDVGDLLAYAAFVADLLSGPGFRVLRK